MSPNLWVYTWDLILLFIPPIRFLECVWCPFVPQVVGCPLMGRGSPHLQVLQAAILWTMGRNTSGIASWEAALNHVLLLTAEELGKWDFSNLCHCQILFSAPHPHRLPPEDSSGLMSTSLEEGGGALITITLLGWSFVPHILSQVNRILSPTWLRVHNIFTDHQAVNDCEEKVSPPSWQLSYTLIGHFPPESGCHSFGSALLLPSHQCSYFWLKILPSPSSVLPRSSWWGSAESLFPWSRL